MQFSASTASSFNSTAEPFKNDAGYELLDVEDDKYSIGKQARAIFFHPNKAYSLTMLMRCIALHCVVHIERNTSPIKKSSNVKVQGS